MSADPSVDLGRTFMTKVTAVILILCAAALLAVVGVFAVGWVMP